jgi:ubiquinone/menaquinone biosynthesis C-methylase UbiE
MIMKRIVSTICNIGGNNKKNREIWLQNILAKIPPNSKILDAGAGEMANYKFCRHLEYISQDLCQYKGTGDYKGLQTGEWDTSKIDIVSSITHIPVPDNNFNAVLCTEVLEHLPEPVLALKEFKRILKKGGELIITAPFCSITHFAPYHYVTGFNKYFYEYHLNKLNFRIIEITPNGNFFGYMTQELKRLEYVTKKYVGRKLSLFYKGFIYLIIALIKSLNRKNNKSDELLCYGYHVLAEKKSNFLKYKVVLVIRCSSMLLGKP